MFEKALQDTLVLLATIDPIGKLPIFVTLTAGLTTSERRAVALRALLYSVAVLVGAIVLGQILLDAMGVRRVSFRLGAGVIIFLFSLHMVFGPPVRMRKKPEHDITAVTVAFPGMATPPAILAAILLTDNSSYPVAIQIGTTLIGLTILAMTFVFLVFSDRIIGIIGMNGASALTKVMGLLVAVFSADLVVNGLDIDARM